MNTILSADLCLPYLFQVTTEPPPFRVMSSLQTQVSAGPLRAPPWTADTEPQLSVYTST